MSYASGTTHYNLPQTVGSDKRDWTDTNQAFSDIDAAIYGAAQGASAATSAIETINGEIETITGKQAVDEGNISTLSGKVSTLESTVGTQAAAIADVRQDLQDNIESKREASATSTHAYEIGDTFYYNDVLYKATAQIAIGGTIVPSTNCTAVTVMSELDQLKTVTQNISLLSSDSLVDIAKKIAAAIDVNKITSKTAITINNGWICHVFFTNPSTGIYRFICSSLSSQNVLEGFALSCNTLTAESSTAQAYGWSSSDAFGATNAIVNF